MLLSREEAHKIVDRIFDDRVGETNIGEIAKEDAGTEKPVAKRKLPEGKRVVRTKSSGDRVYYLDEVKKTRQWVYNPEVLNSLGFEMGDVGEIEDVDLLRYSMGPAILKPIEKIDETS